jgi:hypothetical protein
MTDNRRKSFAQREELRLVIAMVCMHAEIAAARGLIDDNSELAARALRRADMLLKLHQQSGEKT